MEDKKQGLIDMLKFLGSPDFDAQAYGRSESMAGILANQECMMTNPDEGSAQTLAYWEQRGLKKELHDTQTVADSWASYLPMAYVNGTDGGRKYPLLFVMHGSNNPIYLAESYGYTHIAAREQLIVIIPTTETPEKIQALLDYAKVNYPVDWSRVYMVGYSLGGFMTARHGMRWPEKFAAVGIGGMMFANGRADTHWQFDTPWPGETITPEMVEAAAKIKLPVCVCMGEQEVLGLVPVTQDEPVNEYKPQDKPADGHEEPRIDLSGKNKIASVNNWRKVNGCSVIPENEVREQARESADIVTEKLGFPFEKTSVILWEGRSHYVGDCINTDGENLARFICIGKSSHWPSRALTELTWEFISRFARNPETKELKEIG